MTTPSPYYITVNGNERLVSEHDLPYPEIVALMGKPNDSRLWTITVHYPDREHRDRTVAPGERCPVVSGMAIEVAHASRA